jgi:indoleamine 2,3-dioxygenase
MPICTASGAPGLLARNALGPAVERLPDLTEQVRRYRENQHVLSALYRDYTFLASAYLLEPCHHRLLATRGSEYGVARERLPANIARPIAEVATLTGFMPFMEYAGSYALANYRLLEEGRGIEFGNLGLVRAFEAGLERGSSEEGFVLVHVDMVRHSGGLVVGAVKALEGAGGARRGLFLEGLDEMRVALVKVNEAMESEFCLQVSFVLFYFFIFIFNFLFGWRWCGQLMAEDRNVEPEQAQRVHRFPHLHLRHH